MGGAAARGGRRRAVGVVVERALADLFHTGGNKHLSKGVAAERVPAYRFEGVGQFQGDEVLVIVTPAALLPERAVRNRHDGAAADRGGDNERVEYLVTGREEAPCRGAEALQIAHIVSNMQKKTQQLALALIKALKKQEEGE
jgi:hypothetical protein